MFGWFWDWSQQDQINRAQEGLGRAQASQRDLRVRVEELESKLDAMALYSAALWELVSARTGITPEELRRKMEEVDLRDGVRDGRITPQPKTCSRCGRTLAARHQRCVYCGAT